MKLVEILAKELKEWPEGGYTRIVQTIKELNLPIDNEDVMYSSDQWDYSNASSRIYDAEFETSELADDYQTAIVTKEMWEAEKAKLNAQNTPVFDPIYCRDRIKEIDSLVESLEEERVSLVQALEDEGFALISTALVSAAPVEDMSDWRNWKGGDIVEVVKEICGHEFAIGQKVVISYIDLELSDEEDATNIKAYDLSKADYWYLNPEEVKFHSRPQ